MYNQDHAKLSGRYQGRTIMAEITQMSPPTFEYEAEFQSWLAANPGALEPGLWVVGYEFPIGANRADLLAVDGSGRLVVIEVKRANATREAVGQVLDYVSALEEMGSTEIVSAIDAAEARPEFAAVADFEREFTERYGDAQLSDLMPARALLAATSESQETGRVLAYLQDLGMDIRSVVFKGALAEDGKRTYQRKRGTQPQDVGEGEAQSPEDDELGEREPCRAPFPKDGKKGRIDLEQIHQRSEEYPGVDLFRSVHCAIVHALPTAREIALPARTKARELTAAIAFDMGLTPEDRKDRRTARPEYLRIRMFPEESPGEVLLVLFDRALRRAGDALALLTELNEYLPFAGESVQGERLDHIWITAESWPTDEPILALTLEAIHEGWKAEREAGRG